MPRYDEDIRYYAWLIRSLIAAARIATPETLPHVLDLLDETWDDAIGAYYLVGGMAGIAAIMAETHSSPDGASA